MPYGLPLQSQIEAMRTRRADFEANAAESLKAAEKHQSEADAERANAEEYSRAAQACRFAIAALETAEEAHP